MSKEDRPLQMQGVPAVTLSPPSVVQKKKGGKDSKTFELA